MFVLQSALFNWRLLRECVRRTMQKKQGLFTLAVEPPPMQITVQTLEFGPSGRQSRS